MLKIILFILKFIQAYCIFQFKVKFVVLKIIIIIIHQYDLIYVLFHCLMQ